ncbi:hypothetical protein CPB84DRAFT_1769221 [Gymnopilus junonius]|uniref:Secreted protein n=1 Tax=Gymnopilus junonius TaxID=109634 RepID=A0A9P5NWN2_GYMJU|nr:hypothetical protein CPB84DRAFT_1769221 [Gymnopilus junonius]
MWLPPLLLLLLSLHPLPCYHRHGWVLLSLLLLSQGGSGSRRCRMASSSTRRCFLMLWASVGGQSVVLLSAERVAVKEIDSIVLDETSYENVITLRNGVKPVINCQTAQH